MKLTRRGLIGVLGAGGSEAFGQHGAQNARRRVETRRAAVLVCGGGSAGIAAALMAARGGAQTLLVERYGRLGGMAVRQKKSPRDIDVRNVQRRLFT